MKMDIVACTDKWFVMPMGVMMYSVCVNNPDVDIVFHVIHDESVTSKDRRDLEDTVAVFKGKSITFYHIDVTKFPCFPKTSMKARITPASYYRLMLSEILPKTIRKVLYLDGDMIVRHSLLPLWNTDLKDYPVGAVPDRIEWEEDFYNRLNIPPQLGYFNSGLLLVNLEYWQEHDTVKEFLCILQEYAYELKYHDQDVLNIAFSSQKVVLPIKYNLISGFIKKRSHNFDKYEIELKNALKDPVIVHFTADKPWYTYSRFSEHPFASTFFKYQSQTKWKGVKIDKRSFKLRVINYVADMLRKYGLKSQVSSRYEYIDVAPID
jgi:lipopolysaccharide biosynthesis glycosyltransferase